MRSLNFRDNVLWAVAYKLGLDPVTDLLTDQALALGHYIQAWVRRLWPSMDWPEWTVIESAVPSNHIVAPLALLGSGLTTVPIDFDRVFKVYLADPRATDAPVDTPHTLLAEGIHVGFEHGPTVWIKFQSPPPVFTAEVWDSNRTYAKDDPTYLPATGECYKSMADGNKGNDPAASFGVSRNPGPDPQIIQNYTPPNPGINAIPKIQSVRLARADGTPILDPPPNGQQFTIQVYDASHALIAANTQTANGTNSLATILGALRTALIADPDLATFTITNYNATLTMTFQNASDFLLFGYHTPATTASYLLTVTQTQGYIPGLSPVAGTPIQIKLQLTNAQVIPNATYKLVFTDTLGGLHTVTYTATANDAAAQVMAGLMANIQGTGANDPVLAMLNLSLDPSTASLVISKDTPITLETSVESSGSQWWTLVPFPAQLVDPVVRGAYADVLKEEGQSEKAGIEEQAVPTETELQARTKTFSQTDRLTEQQSRENRYAVG